jgi:hypothetical protein
MHLKDTSTSLGGSQSHLSHRVRAPPGSAHTRTSSSASLAALSPFSEPRTYTTLFASTTGKHLISDNNPQSRDLDVPAYADELGHHLARAPRVASASAMWMLYVYAFVSLIFFSAAAYSVFESASRGSSHYIRSRQQLAEDDFEQLSYLDNLPTSLRLSRLVSIQPPPVDFEPSFLWPEIESGNITACLWSSDENLQWVGPWTTAWDGKPNTCIHQ